MFQSLQVPWLDVAPSVHSSAHAAAAHAPWKATGRDRSRSSSCRPWSWARSSCAGSTGEQYAVSSTMQPHAPARSPPWSKARRDQLRSEQIGARSRQVARGRARRAARREQGDGEHEPMHRHHLSGFSPSVASKIAFRTWPRHPRPETDRRMRRADNQVVHALRDRGRGGERGDCGDHAQRSRHRLFLYALDRRRAAIDRFGDEHDEAAAPRAHDSHPRSRS